MGLKLIQGSSLYVSNANVARGLVFMPYPSSKVSVIKVLISEDRLSKSLSYSEILYKKLESAVS